MAGKQLQEQSTWIRPPKGVSRRARRGARFVLRWLILPLGTCVGAHAQREIKEIEGRILDSQGNTVARAKVTLRSTLTGAGQDYFTTDSGQYSFFDIPPGEYILTAVANGLATETGSVQVAAASPTQIEDITLPIAKVHESVTVVSGSRVEELQHDSPLPIDVVTQQRIEWTGYENVADVLGELLGVVTRNNASFSGAAQEQIDGIASQDVLVLQDGLPIVGARDQKRR